MDWMPEYYVGDNVKAMQEARDEELDYEKEEQDRVYGDMYISRAQDVTLWENEYGITPESDDLEQRRKSVMAYIRSNGGAATKAMIRAVVASYTGNDDVVVTEYPDQFLIRITCTYDATEEMYFSEVEKMVLAMIQAHADALIDQVKKSKAVSDLYLGMAIRGQFDINPIIET